MFIKSFLAGIAALALLGTAEAAQKQVVTVQKTVVKNASGVKVVKTTVTKSQLAKKGKKKKKG